MYIRDGFDILSGEPTTCFLFYDIYIWCVVTTYETTWSIKCIRLQATLIGQLEHDCVKHGHFCGWIKKDDDIRPGRDFALYHLSVKNILVIRMSLHLLRNA